MKFQKTILFAIILFTTIDSNACDCKELGPLNRLRKFSYEHSDIVFLGKLINTDTINYTYTFKIIELYKGYSRSSIIKGKYFDSCSKFPRDKGKWIVYADFKNGLIDISSCLASRSERHPFCVKCYPPPPPPFPNETKLQKKVRLRAEKNFNKDINKKSRRDWKEEVEILSQMKRKGTPLSRADVPLAQHTIHTSVYFLSKY